MDEIQHYGVKGMKWGVRKAVQRSKARRSLKKQSAKRERSWKTEYQKRGSMSNADLKKKVERLRLENEFAKLASEASKGQKAMAKNAIKSVSKETINQGSQAVVKTVIKKAMTKAATGGIA